MIDITKINIGTIKGLAVSSNNGELRFQTRSGGTLYDRLVINQDGKVGVGTIYPDNLLHLESSSNVYIQLEKVATASKIYLGNVSGKCVLEATAGAIELKPNNIKGYKRKGIAEYKLEKY